MSREEFIESGEFLLHGLGAVISNCDFDSFMNNEITTRDIIAMFTNNILRNTIKWVKCNESASNIIKPMKSS